MPARRTAPRAALLAAPTLSSCMYVYVCDARDQKVRVHTIYFMYINKSNYSIITRVSGVVSTTYDCVTISVIQLSVMKLALMSS